jgi:hypothetical protein
MAKETNVLDFIILNDLLSNIRLAGQNSFCLFRKSDALRICFHVS